jgi:hypothetical protein
LELPSGVPTSRELKGSAKGPRRAKCLKQNFSCTTALARACGGKESRTYVKIAE